MPVLPELYRQHHPVTGLPTDTGKPHLLHGTIPLLTKYMAGGVRTIIAVARNGSICAWRAYVFQPYEPFIRSGEDRTEAGRCLDEALLPRVRIADLPKPVGTGLVQPQLFDGLKEPWAWSLNFGYILFNQKAQE
jgi:hypothetical protein